MKYVRDGMFLGRLPMTQTKHFTSDDAVWNSRCWHWRDQLSRSNKRQSRKQKNKGSLILAGHGISLRIEGGSLAIRGGFTHYPQKQETSHFFRGALDLPERIILLDCSGSISFDVISWLAEQNIPLIQINWKGEIICLSGTSAYSANPEHVRWQIETFSDKSNRIEFCRSIIGQKIEASILTLEKSIPRSEKWELAMRVAYSVLGRLDENCPQSPLEIMALEANSAAAYFRAWGGIPINWRGTRRRPIPESWRQIGPRSSPFQLTGNHNAAHPVNAMLNYAYAVLESQIRIKAISAGYDPTLGIMHHGRDRSSKFVFDLMEPERPRVDRRILEFVKSSIFDPADFTIRSDGVCRLNPEMARVVVDDLAKSLRS
jgi:CRISPR-associated protein Cas1